MDPVISILSPVLYGVHPNSIAAAVFSHTF
jgi:hypothetical protein